MILYCDTSALVKLFVTEDGSGDVRRWSDSSDILATCEVAYVEIVGALARRARNGIHTLQDASAVRQALDEAWPTYVVAPVGAREAADIAERHPLRALDAIHVAAAVTLAAEAGSTNVTFASFDDRQRAAAQAQGLVVLPRGEGLEPTAVSPTP